MKVLNLRGINDLRLEERDIPKPGEDEVLVEIHACGICSSDEARVLKTGTYHFPTVPGHEICGKIVKVGKGVNKELLNRKVAIFPLLPCFECQSCKEKHYQVCSNYKYFGSRNDGGFSEYLVVPKWNLVLLNDSVEYKIGALMEPSAVSLHAVKIGNVKENDNVLIVGTGTIGILIGFFAQLRGANVWISGRRQKALDLVKELSLNTVNVDDPIEDVEIITNGKRMDVVFEAVGSSSSLEKCILATKNSGTIVVVGNPHGDINLEKDTYWKVLRRQLKIKGTWNSDYSDEENDWKEIAKIMATDEIPFEKLITRTFELKDHKEAFDLLANKEESKLKLMFRMNEDKE